MLALSIAVALAQSVSGQPPATWPNLEGRVGPYGGVMTVADAQRMTGDGLTLTVLSTSAPPVLEAFRAGGAAYIDNWLWERIHGRCTAQAAASAGTCTLSAEDSDAIVQQAVTHLRDVQSDPGLAAFWILDDYPGGDVSSTLAKLHAAVAASNQASGIRRATICGIGGSLDVKTAPLSSTFVANHRYFDRALTNISPAACDIVAPYFYGTAPADDPALVDWSLRDLLPYALGKLKEKGFDTSGRFLLPIVHAFSFKAANSRTYYVTPRPDDIAAQMKAYCGAGVLGTLFFTWASKDADQSYANNAAIRAGVQQGRRECEASGALTPAR